MRRARILAFCVLLLGLSGCLSGSLPDTPGETPTPTEVPPGTPTPTEAPPGTPAATETAVLTETPGPTPHEWHELVDRPDATQTIRVNNEWNRSVEIRVAVIRNTTNRTVHNASYHLPPGTDKTVYNVSAADPDGIEPFTVVVTARNTTRRATLKTNACYAAVYADIRQDGTLSVAPVIC